MKKSLMKSTHLIKILCLLLAITFISSVIPLPTSYAQSLNYINSWIANTGGTPQTHIMQDIRQIFVDLAGRTYAITDWDEGGANIQTFDSNGNLGPKFEETGTGSWGRNSGRAVSGDGTYIYQAFSQNGSASTGGTNSFGGPSFPPNSSTTWYGVRRYNISTGKGAGFSGGALYDGSMLIVNTNGSHIQGIAVRNGELFVADPTDNKIKVYPAMGTTLKRSWSVAKAGQLNFDSQGYLWVLQRSNGTDSAKLVRYDINGNLQSQQIIFEAGRDISSFGIDLSNNRIYVCDNGPSQNIKIYTNIFSSPTLLTTFGNEGGIYSGVSGEIEPLKFAGLTGVGIDNSGNIYVSMNGNKTNGTSMFGILESYTSSGTLRWRKMGMAFVDCADADPYFEEDVYTGDEKYFLNYSNSTPGTEWTLKAITFNRFKFPDDPRVSNSFKTPWIRRINGNKFMYITDMYGEFVFIYRFNYQTDGEIAIPCGKITKTSIWIDSNGNGSVDAGETQTFSADNQYGMGWSVSRDGDIWYGARNNGIRRYIFQGLNSYGCPIYSRSSSQFISLPSGVTDVKRIEYDSETDKMFLAGYTSNLPNNYSDGDTWWAAGRAAVQINNWSTGNRTITYTYQLPWWEPTGNAKAAKSIAAAGNYLFAVNSITGEIVVYDTTNGTEKGRISPTYSTGGISGWIDVVNGIRAYKRDNNEYIIFVEEDGYAKVNMYRWSPEQNLILSSQNKNSSSSSQQLPNNLCTNANDGNSDTRWAASSGSYPQWWKVDLGSTKNISKFVAIWFGTEGRTYKYKIEISNDDSNYTTIIDKTNNNISGKTIDTFSSSARYVRITITGSTSGWASAYEFKVYGQ